MFERTVWERTKLGTWTERYYVKYPKGWEGYALVVIDGDKQACWDGEWMLHSVRYHLFDGRVTQWM